MSAIGIIATSPLRPMAGMVIPTIAIAAARAGATGVIDAEFLTCPDSVLKAAESLHANAERGSVGLRYSCGQFATVSGALAVLAADSQTATPAEAARIVIITAATGQFEKAVLQNEITLAHNAGFKVFVETINPDEALLAQTCGADAVIAKGHEAGGRVGDSTAFVLTQQYLTRLEVPVWVQGGIGLHTIAAVAAAGAAGVVLDSQTYLCREAQLPPTLQMRLANCDGTETTLLQGPHRHSFRLLASGAIKLPTDDKLAADNWSAPLLQLLQTNHNSEPTANDLWPIGQDACFAKSIAQRGVTVAGAIDALIDCAQTNIQIADKLAALAPDSPLAKSHGTCYPIVQGAMTRVSDTADFARQVARGGALPFLALSLMRAAEIDTLLAQTSAGIDNLPWGVGLLGFVPSALRKEQLEVVERYRPPFALIAGGRPDQAKALEEAGTKCYLHVPSPMLLKSFVEMGSRRFVFEGKECGGHVGPRSSFVLWETMIDELLAAIGPRENAATFHVLFAGGIHDDVSAAMVASLAAPLCARGINIGVLVGTAYLFTEEAVSSGAIVQKFQQAAIECKETTLLETGPGHSIRCIESPYKATFDQRRQQLQSENRSADEVREELELMNLGRLRIASKGLTRRPSADLAVIDNEEQWRDGMYMIGQIASMHDAVITIESLHATISNGGQQLLASRCEPAATVTTRVVQAEEGIAIVGMSCMLPQANDVEQYWQNIINRVDCITEIPDTHFDWRNYYDSDPQAPDKIVSKWGGFLSDVIFDPSRYGIPPSSLAAIDPMQVLILEAARQALDDAGYSQRKFGRKKTSVLVANAGHGPITALYCLRSMLGWKLDGLDEKAQDQLMAKLPKWTEDSFAGYLGNVTAGRVANRFDLGGINFAIDAACASSLAALYVGINELRSKSSDVVLLGSTDTHNQPGDYLSFSKTHALSADGRCKTFDISADGIVISEGIAMLVLKRLSDAERDGDRIYAVIRGIGGSSDGRDFSLTAPRADGQVAALERAYENAGISPSTVQLVEAHGTGTVAGDKAEVEALTKVFSRSGASKENCAIGSVKTNIGHTKATAGLASIIKVAKALHHKIMPPTINVKEPNPSCKFGEGPFYLSADYSPWIKANEGMPRRAAVSAFGFGGTNFHAILEEYVSATAGAESPVMHVWPSELFVWRSNSTEQIKKSLGKLKKDVGTIQEQLRRESTATSAEQRQLFKLALKTYWKSQDNPGGQTLLAIVATSLENLVSQIDEALSRLKQPEPDNFQLAGIHYAGNIQQNKVCFLFPGQGSQKVDMLKELSLFFPQIRQSAEAADETFGDSFPLPLSKYIYPAAALSAEQKRQQQLQLTQTEIAQPAVGVSSIAMLGLLGDLGIKADMAAGHSYGEYVALHAAGVIKQCELLAISAERGRLLAACAEERPGIMAAIAADEQTVAATICDIADLYLANINTPQQVIISGSAQSIDTALKLFLAKGIAGKKIAVSAAFHTPFMEPARKSLRTALQNLNLGPASFDVFSNLTAKPHTFEPTKLIEQLVEHIVQPVRFARQLEAIKEAGANIFLEVGPGSVLTNLTKQTLGGKDVIALACDGGSGNSLHTFLDVLATLLVNGVPVDCGKLFFNRTEDGTTTSDASSTATSSNRLLYRVNSNRMQRLDSEPASTAPVTGQQQVNPQPLINELSVSHLSQIKEKALQSTEKPGSNQPAADGIEKVMLEFQQSMLQMTNRFLETQQQVMLAYLQSQSQSLSPLPAATESVEKAAIQPAATFHQTPIETAKTPVASGEPTADSNESDAAEQSDYLIEKLFEIVSERTGYPTEMLDPALDLEADLGIDSIKRIEILNSFRKVLPSHVQENLEGQLETLAATKTLQGIADWLREFNIPDRAAPSTNETMQIVNPQGIATTGNISRGLLAIEPLAAPCLIDQPLCASTLIITDCSAIEPATSAEITRLLCDKLQQRGDKCIVVSHGPSNDLTDEQVVTKLVTAIQKEHGGIGAVINLLAANNSSQPLKALFNLIKAVGLDLKQPAPGYRKSFLTATFMGGGFGVKELTKAIALPQLSQQAGMVGLVKTVAKEWPDVHVKAIDFDSNEDASTIANTIFTELLVDDNTVEIGLFKGQRITLTVQEADNSKATESLQLDKKSVLLVTGGARGITARITLDLARQFQANFILIGRLPRPAERESKITSGLTSVKEIKAAIIADLQETKQSAKIRDVERRYQLLMREREVRQSLAAIQATGATVKYFCVDVADEVAFGNLIDNIYETYGTVTAVIHGAGVIEDSLLADKNWDSFERVFNTKVSGALTLLRHLRLDKLKYLSFFSSIVGRTGNQGQSDYSAANEALNKLAVYANQQTPGRVCSLMWGPWEAGMAPPELKEAFAAHGWSMINLEQGSLSFQQELISGKKNDVEVMLVGSAPAQNKVPQDTASTLLSDVRPAGVLLNGARLETIDPPSYVISIATKEHRYLLDHQIGGMPVMPMTGALELMLEAAQAVFPDHRVQQVLDLDIPAGIMFDRAEKEFRIQVVPSPITAARTAADRLSATIKIESTAAHKKSHYCCTIELVKSATKTAADAGSFSKFSINQPEKCLPTATELYGKWLFHGPIFQGLKQVSAMGINGIEGQISGSDPQQCLTTASNNQWLIDPILLDSAMQLAGIWARHYFDITVLPTGFKSLQLFQSGAKGNFDAQVLCTGSSAIELICDLTIYDAAAKPVLILKGLTGVGSKAFNRFASHGNFKELAR